MAEARDEGRAGRSGLICLLVPLPLSLLLSLLLLMLVFSSGTDIDRRQRPYLRQTPMPVAHRGHGRFVPKRDGCRLAVRAVGTVQAECAGCSAPNGRLALHGEDHADEGEFWVAEEDALGGDAGGEGEDEDDEAAEGLVGSARVWAWPSSDR